MKKNINIQNKKANFEYLLLDEYIVGIQLLGTEIKSIRQNKVNINNSFCQIKNGEMYIINMHISEYNIYAHKNHFPTRERKLLLKKHELLKLTKKIKLSGLTIIPTKLFINDKGYVKIQIFLAKGKKIYDKRKLIRARDIQREHEINIKNIN